MSPPELDELTPYDYSSEALNAREELKNPQQLWNPQNTVATAIRREELLDEEGFAQLVAADE